MHMEGRSGGVEGVSAESVPHSEGSEGVFL